jgi:hypothetical protein
VKRERNLVGEVDIWRAHAAVNREH